MTEKELRQKAEELQAIRIAIMQNAEKMRVAYGRYSTKDDIMKIECAKVAVVVFICKPSRVPVVYDITDVDEAYIDEAVKAKVADITKGCAYDYKFVRKIDNAYFFE